MSLLDDARRLTAAGLPVFPCVRSENPKRDKAPATQNGFLDASLDPDRFTWNDAEHRIGVPMGEISGLICIDDDRHKHGIPLDTEYGGRLVVTQSGGKHHFYAWRPGYKSAQNTFEDKVDTRSDGGYVCVYDVDELITAKSYAADGFLPGPPPLPPEKIHTTTGEEKAARGYTLDEARQLVMALVWKESRPPRDAWRNVGMALHHEFSGSEGGFDIWDEWSRTRPDLYTTREHLFGQWEKFRSERADACTMGTIKQYYYETTGDHPPRTAAETQALLDLFDVKPLVPATPAATVEGEEPDPDAPVDFGGLDVADMLASPAPPRMPFISNPDGSIAMVDNINGLLTGSGGVGKSLVMLDLCLCAAAGLISGHGLAPLLWLGHFKVAPRHAFLIATEDDADEIHRRLAALFEARTRHLMFDPEAIEKVREVVAKFLHIYVVQGDAFPVTSQDPSGRIVPGGAVQSMINMVNACAGPCVIAPDPLRRFTAGKEDGEAFNAVIKAYDMVRAAADHPVVILTGHHNSKSAGKDSDNSQHASRGASDLVDGMRKVFTLRNMTEGEGEKFLPEGEDRRDYRVLSGPKSNYSAADTEDFLKFENGSFCVVELFDLTLINEEKERDSVANTLLDLMREEGKPVSLRHIQERWCGVDNVLGVAKQRISSIIEQLRRANKIAEISTGNYTKFIVSDGGKGVIN